MSITFINWNLNNSIKTLSLIPKLIEYITPCENIILLFTECEKIPYAEFQKILPNLHIVNYLNPSSAISNNSDLKFFSTFDNSIFYTMNDSHDFNLYVTALELNSKKIMIAGVHIPSIDSRDRDSQVTIVHTFNKAIKNQEEILFKGSIPSKIILGDFNMNPFDRGMIEPLAFHSTNSSDIARKKREYFYEKYERLYNPMWSLLGDFKYSTNEIKIPGSFYLDATSETNEIHWNLVDGVIISEDLIDVFDRSSLEIIELHKLISPDFKFNKFRKEYSNHLPIKFIINVN